MFKTVWLLAIMLAIAQSWSINSSIWWAMLAAVEGPFYVTYWFLKYTMLSEEMLRCISG